MTLKNLLDCLSEWAERELKDISLPVKQDGYDGQPEYRPIKAYQMAMDDPSDAEERVPYVLLQLINGTKEEATVRWVITTYDKDRHQGKLAVLNLVERIMMGLQRDRVVGGCYKLLDPIEYLFYTDDTGPYHLAELATKWTTPTVEREIPGLHDPYWG
jgi:hypothetical protein